MLNQTTDVKLCYNMIKLNFFIYSFYKSLTCAEVILKKSPGFNYWRSCLITTLFSNVYFCFTHTTADSQNKDFKGKQVITTAINKYKKKNNLSAYRYYCSLMNRREYVLATVKQ